AMRSTRIPRLASVLLVVAFGISAAVAQVITTYAGGVVVEDQPATTTPLSQPRGLAVDRQGNLYIAETGAGLIRKVEAATGIATVIAGGGTLLDDARPIPARQALLDGPNSPVVDPFGNVFFSDTNNHRIRKITPDGMITTVAGTGIQGGGGVGDGGPATRAPLNMPLGLYLDSVGNLLIVESVGGDQARIRMVTAATGVIQTIAGGGTGGEGSRALEYRLSAVGGVTQDRQGNILLVANSGSGDGRVLRIDRASSIVTTVVGGGTAFNPPLPAAPRSLQLCGTTFVAVDSAGTIYFDGCGGVQKLDPSDNLVKNFFNGSGWGGQVVLDSSDTIFAATVGGLVYRIEREQTGRVVAGTEDAFDGLFANLAALGVPWRLAFDGQGNLYIADSGQSLGRIRRVDRGTGIITTVETGNVGGLAIDRAGNAYFASYNTGIRKFEAGTGRLTTLVPPAGSSEGVRLAEGILAADARVYGSSGLAVDAAGNLYFITTGSPGTTITASPVYERIWMLEASSGLLRVVAGNGTRATTGDGGPAREASLANPIDIALDGRGNLLIVSFAPRLRQVNLATGIITSIPVDLFDQYGVTVDGQGNIYVSQGHRVGVMVGGRFVPIAGSGQRGFFGDGGLATLARLNEPAGLAVDPEGNLYIADSLNSRVRKVSAVSVTPVLTVSANSLEFAARQGQLPPSPQRVSITGGNLVPSAWTAEITTQTGGNWLAVSPPSGTTPASLQVGVNPANLTPGLYRGAVNIVSPGASGSPQTIAVTLNVQSTNPPAIGLSQQFLSFTALQGGSSPPAQSVSLTNTGGGVLTFALQTETSAGGTWLQVSASSATAPATLTVRANSANLAAGQYQGLITIQETTTGATRPLAVSLLVSRAVPILQVSQTGLLFLGVEGSLTLRPQTLTIQNRGQGVMSWRVTTSVPGGGDWLRATPDRGTSDAANPQAAPSVTVTVDPTRLRAGIVTGLLILTAEGAPNSPFVVLVLVSMQAPGSEPVGLLSPAGLIFTALAGSTAPLTQEVTVSTTGGRQLQFLAGVRTERGGNWLSLSPNTGTLLGSTESVALQVTASPAGLAAGVYVGVLTVSFGTGLVQDVAIALVVSPAASS
ncbi:MAG: hypothetical protein HY647_03170, partial [Acidobacteria bacterium]|nr:hypothetical protein [Acidobacteriota bacterium]